jgi:galactoside O-acetyltransferase
MGERSRIDDLVFLNVGQSCKIGRFVHIASFCSIIGGGELVMHDFSGLSAGCRIVTGTEDFCDGSLTNPTVPYFRDARRGRIVIGKHAILGTNVIVFPDVTIGEGAAVGAGCIVRRDLRPWGVYAGTNPRRIRDRNREAVLEKERLLLEKLGLPRSCA